MTDGVVIIDYGIGNISSVLRAVKKFTKNCKFSADPQDILKAKRLILPGDGAFGDTMKEINNRGLIKPILSYISQNKPFLGICVGMQILATEGEEFGLHKGLNIIPGRVAKFPISTKFKTPQIGWNKLIMPSSIKSWKGTILEGISQGEWVYFIHSYIVIPQNSGYNLALTNYAGTVYSSVVMKGNISACQFHPEKSAITGLKIIKNFILSNEKKD